MQRREHQTVVIQREAIIARTDLRYGTVGHAGAMQMERHIQKQVPFVMLGMPGHTQWKKIKQQGDMHACLSSYFLSHTDTGPKRCLPQCKLEPDCKVDLFIVSL